jgi:hypothetical protein
MRKRLLSLIALLPLLGMGQNVVMTGHHRTVTAVPTTVTHVQSCGYQIPSSSPSSVSVICLSTITPGNFLWICVANVNSAVNSPTWSGDSGTFTLDMANTSVTGSTYGSCYKVASAGGGGTTITLTASNLSWTGLTLEEFANVGLLDVNDTPVEGGPSSSPASNSISPTANGDLILGFSTVSAGGGPPTYTAGTGFTLGAGSTYTAQNEYLVQTTAAPISATFALSNSTRSWVAHAAAYKHK